MILVYYVKFNILFSNVKFNILVSYDKFNILAFYGKFNILMNLMLKLTFQTKQLEIAKAEQCEIASNRAMRDRFEVSNARSLCVDQREIAIG